MLKLTILLVASFISSGFSEELPSKPKRTELIDNVHGKLSTGVLRLSNRIDRFFGSKRAEDQANGSQIKLAYITSISKDGDIEHEGLIKFRLKLPYLENLLKLSFSKEPAKGQSKKEEKPSEAGTEGKDIKAPKTQNKLTKAILSEPSKWSLNFNTGVKVEIPPQFFANLRLRRSVYFGKWEFRFSQEFFWFSRDGFGETSTIDFDRPISSTVLFRLRNSATWMDETDEFQTEHGPSIFWQISKRRAVSFNARATGRSRPDLYIDKYSTNISYRQLLHNRWFYLETGPSLEFPKSNNWKGVFSYYIKFEALIGSY
ncbi:MAG: hypothetical protein CME70_19740 [Halobacteriovorax sp.]|nr:hypothetical protein [Halobacteriovorax sp.]|tara:strand:- start:11081 stop:12025 length:945 start_codon:yes stop_codon:yes gene_type:complete